MKKIKMLVFLVLCLVPGSHHQLLSQEAPASTWPCEVNVKGIVKDDKGKPLAIEVSLVDKKNNVLVKAMSDIDGVYKLKAEIKEPCTLVWSDLLHFPVTELLDSARLASGNSLQVDKVLRPLRLGQIYDLVWFDPDRLIILTSTEAAPVKALAALMIKNPKMKIRVEGHATKYELTKNERTTGAYGLKSDSQVADERAFYIFHLLMRYGVPKERLEEKGMGHERLLIADPRTEAEKNKNKRVSVRILSM